MVQNGQNEKQNLLAEIFKGMDAQLNADFDSSAQIKHNPSKGSDRESKLRDMLGDYLPKKFAIGSGAVVDINGNQSRQIDIIIYDASEGFPLYGSTGNQLFPVECVYAVIEVKSTLTASELKKSYKNILSVKNMQKSAYETRWKTPQVTFLYGELYDTFPVLGFVFAYNSSMKLSTVRDELTQIDDNDNISKNIDSLYILRKGVIYNHVIPPIDRYMMIPEKDSERVYFSSNKVLLLFYTSLSTVLTQAWMYPVRVLEYLPEELFGSKNI